jgi:hypothetical protein
MIQYKKKAKNIDDAVLGISFTIDNNRIFWRIYTKTSIEKNLRVIGPMAIINQEMIDKYKSPQQ